MPSVNTNKEQEVVLGSDSTVPVRQIMTAVEHKIRNLEKRKGKLESYQDLRTSGKELSADQEVAISKYEEVVQCLLCAQELLKQIQGIAANWDKDQRKVARKETAARVANEVFKVRETLILQDLLRLLRDADIRSDFETGSNGAVKLDSADLALIDKLLAEGFVSLEGAESEESFETRAHRAADHWVSTVDGKPKQFAVGVTYERVRRVVRTIQDSGYFHRRFGIRSGKSAAEDQLDTVATSRATTENGDPSEGGDELTETTHEAQQLPPATTTVAEDQISIPVLQAESSNVPADKSANFQAFPIHPQPAAAATAVGPVTNTLEVSPNALPEELQSGAFSFLQDSELDEVAAAGGGGGNSSSSGATPVVLTSNCHPSPSPVPVPVLVSQQPMVTPQQPPHANLLLINPMMSIPQPHVVNGGGGVTPPMFSFPFQNAATVATAQPIPANAVPSAMNPFQQLVNTLSYNHMMQMNGGGAHPVPIQNAVPAVVERTEEKSPESGKAGPTGSAEQQQQQMTISEWNPVGKEQNGQSKRETSTDSSSGAERRRHEDKHHRNHRNGNESAGGGAYNGSRRRYMDRPSHNNVGGNFNGSRIQRNGGDGEIGAPTTSSYNNRPGAKPSHYPSANSHNNHHQQHRMNANGGGASNGTFYRNNDPNYYHQNGMKSGRHGQGYTQPQQAHGRVSGATSAAAGGSRN